MRLSADGPARRPMARSGAPAGRLGSTWGAEAMFVTTLGAQRWVFDDLKTLLAKATPARSGDELAGVAAASQTERVAARWALADAPLAAFLNEVVIPYEADEVTRLIVDSHDPAAFAPVSHLTVGAFRDWLLSEAATPGALAALSAGLTPEMVAAVAKLMRNQDLIAVAARRRVTTAFRTTVGLPGRLAVRLQPNHPTDDPAGVAASILDGLILGCGDAMIGINPAGDSLAGTVDLLRMIDDLRLRYAIPTQSCVLAHITTSIEAAARGAPVDLVFQSIAGTQGANRGFGIDLALLAEGRAAVSHIVGRNPDSLDAAGVARAAIESLAENFSDGVVAPALWGALLGLPGIALYKAINTADSMIGHRTPRHAAFGWAAARLDDFVNLPASRLAALLIAWPWATLTGALVIYVVTIPVAIYVYHPKTAAMRAAKLARKA